MKKFIMIILALLLVLGLASCTEQPANNIVNVTAMTYAEYMAASDNAKVVIEGYVQDFASNTLYKSVNMFLQDDDGAYYVYRAVCDDERAASLKIGDLVRVSGVKGSYAGEIEIKEQCTFEILSGSKIYDHADVTALFSDEKALQARMNLKISMKDLVVSESYDKENRVSASLYKWDGSGAAGSGDDVYFSASQDDHSSLLVIESDEHPEDSEVYKAACGLSVGDIVDIEGYMYWYNGPNIHVSSIKVTKHSKPELEKSGGVLSHSEFIMAGDGEAATIEAYVQGLSQYDESSGKFTVFLSDADGAYLAKDIAAEKSVYDKLSKGLRIRLAGMRATENGMPILTGVSYMELLNGYYIDPAENISLMLDDTETLADMAGQKVTVKATQFAVYVPEEGLLQTTGPNGKLCSFTVMPEDHPEGSQVLKTLEGLSIGEAVDLICFIYLDPEPQFRVQSISVK